MDSLVSLLGRNGFLPLGYCFTWSPGLLWSMVGADAVIAAAYFSIPIATLSYVRRRPEPTANWLAWMFSAFIFACGVTHVMDIWTIWQPDYALQALSKVITATISLLTAIALWPLIPRALKIPSVQQLRTVIGDLEAEVARRREAEDRMGAMQQTLAGTLSSIDAGFITTGRDGQITHMNAVAETVTGWSLRSAVGLDVWQVLDLRKVVKDKGRAATVVSMNLLDAMLEDAITVDTVQRVVCIARDGKHTALEVRAALTRANDGQAAGLAVVFRDMSRIDTAEAESERLAAIVESSNDAIIGKTLDGRITSWNGAAQVIFGHTADEAVGQPVQMLIPPDRQSEEMRILAELADGKSVPAFDTVRLRRDGEPLDVSVTISPIKDGAGRVVGASKIARDVTQQRRAETALRDSEERLRFTLEAAQIGDWNLDLATGVMQHSARHDQCFGYAEQLVDWSFDKFIQHVHPEDRAEVEQTLHVAVTELRDWRVQCRVVWPDGSEHWISKHGSVQRKGDKATRMLGIVSEITEQRQAENARLTAQRLDAENRQIQEANRLKSQFLANMSHELRTPLNAVIGFADLLHSGYIKPDSPRHQEFLGHIGASGRHLLQLINDVLDQSKVESGKFEFFPEHVDLPVLLKEVEDVLHTVVSRKNIQISTDIDPDLIDLTLDPARLKQVLYNYLSNAIKFTSAGGRVTVRAMAERPEHFRIEVEDSGIGISAADLPRLFTEFQQLDAGYSKQHQGTGLGLALTRRLVQAQGGQVGVRSTVGAGSVFYVVLNRTDGLDTQRAEAIAFGVHKREAERVLVAARAEAVRSADGEVVGVRGTVQDITDRKRAEADARRIGTIEAENRQIQEASRLKSQFLANMSHELRTPLNAVIGFADLLHSGYVMPDSPNHHEFLGHIGTSGRHLLQLINDVLDLSKVESGKFEFFPEPVDLPVLLKEVQDVLHTAVSRKTIHIATDIDADLIDLTLDPARLKQVLYNYLSNAIKFTPAGGRVTVRAMADGPEHFRIEVEDTGIGISAADLPRLFSEFQQLDAGYSKQHQGTGLGLALTRRLVQAQGGQVGVHSTVGVGSVFSVVLNRRHGLDTNRAEAIASGVAEREAERVLVIEDDLRDQALLIKALSQAGFEVDAAADSPFALRRARETDYAALTLDLSLPGQRGLELLDDIRSRGASHASPVVGVTMPADLGTNATFAIANVLCKPIRSDEISSAMNRFRPSGEPRANVMVIDDDPTSLDVMRAMLKSIGIDAVCFQDGRVALQEIDRHRPDAIVLDLMMPAFDGFQVLDALQRLPVWRDVPVFIWTSMLLTDEEYATLARSAHAILIKGGGTMEAVLESVRRWRQPVVAAAGAKP